MAAAEIDSVEKIASLVPTDIIAGRSILKLDLIGFIPALEPQGIGIK